MSVLIKGMEMPNNCPSCPFNSRAWYEDSHLCLASNKQITVNLNTGFDDNCPIVPVPPHRRLIDADEFFNDICNSLNEMTAIGVAVDGEWMWGKLNDALDNAPTVIEAEEGK